MNVMQSDWRLESAMAALAAIWRMDFRGTRLDILPVVWHGKGDGEVD